MIYLINYLGKDLVNNMEMYYAINKKTGEIFDNGGIYKHKMSWAKLGHLKGIFTCQKKDINDYDIYKVEVIKGMPCTTIVEEAK